MSASTVRQQCELARGHVAQAADKLEHFLNGHTLAQLAGEQPDKETLAFYKGLLADFRHLLVFSEVSYERIGVALRRANFEQPFAEKALYELYHHCVHAFFNPKHEAYTEDGRYAYTGQEAIRFRMAPEPGVKRLVQELSRLFEELREELSYYESDYMSERRMQLAP